jgi:hypothetical protein
MLLESGNKLLVTHRRLFERDAARYFVGEVLAYDAGIVKLKGYSFVRDIGSSQLLRKDDARTKLVSLSAGSFIVYQLPDDVDISSAEIEWTRTSLFLREGDRVLMNLAELPREGKI